MDHFPQFRGQSSASAQGPASGRLSRFCTQQRPWCPTRSESQCRQYQSGQLSPWQLRWQTEHAEGGHSSEASCAVSLQIPVCAMTGRIRCGELWPTAPVPHLSRDSEKAKQRQSPSGGSFRRGDGRKGRARAEKWGQARAGSKATASNESQHHLAGCCSKCGSSRPDKSRCVQKSVSAAYPPCMRCAVQRDGAMLLACVGTAAPGARFRSPCRPGGAPGRSTVGAGPCGGPARA